MSVKSSLYLICILKILFINYYLLFVIIHFKCFGSHTKTDNILKHYDWFDWSLDFHKLFLFTLFLFKERGYAAFMT